MITYTEMTWTTSSLLLLTSSVLVSAIHDSRPTQTSTADDGFDLLGWTPMPTQMPAFMGSNELRKRAADDSITPPNPTCGYLLGIEQYSFTCYSDKYCGARTDYHVLACCNTYSPVGTDYSLSGCTYETTCYDSTSVSLLNSAQASNSYALYCTSSQYPYCMQYSFTDINYSIYGCNTASNVILDLQLSVNPTASSTSLTISTGITLTPSVTPTASASDGGGSGTNNSGSQNSGSSTPTPVPSKSNTGAIVGGVVGGLALILIAAGACFFFYLRHKRQQQAANNAAGNTPAMAQRPNSPSGKAPEAFVSPVGGMQQNPHSQYHQSGPYSQQAASSGPQHMSGMAPYPNAGNPAWASPGPNAMMGMHDYSRPQSQVSHTLSPSSPVGAAEMPSRVASPTPMPSVAESTMAPPSHVSTSSVSEAHGQPINPPPPPQPVVYQAYNPNGPNSPSTATGGQNPSGQTQMGYHAGPTPDWDRHEMP